MNTSGARGRRSHGPPRARPATARGRRRAGGARRASPNGCSSAFSGHAQARAAEDARRERVEELAPPVAVRARASRNGTRRHELDLGPARASAAASSWSYIGVNAGGSARTTRTVPRLGGGRWPCSCAAGTSSTAAQPPGRRSHLERDGRARLARRAGRRCASRRCRSGRCRGSTRGADEASRGRDAGARAGLARRRHPAAAPGLLRSGVTGQANAILLGPPLAARAPDGRISDGARAARLPRRPARVVVGNLHASNDFGPARSPPRSSCAPTSWSTTAAPGHAWCSRATSTFRAIPSSPAPASTTSSPRVAPARSRSGRRSGASTRRGAVGSRARRDGSDDVRRGAGAVPGARARRVPQRGHVRSARAADRRRDADAARRRSRRGPKRQGVLRAHARAARAALRATLAGAARRRRRSTSRSRTRRRTAATSSSPASTSARSDEIVHDRRGALRPARARCIASGATVRRASTPGRRSRRSSPRSRRARDCSRCRTCSGRRASCSPVDELRSGPASRCSSTARSRSARSRSTPRASTTTRCRARSGSAGRTRPARSTSPTPRRCASRARLVLADATSRRERSIPREGAQRFDPGWLSIAVARRARWPRSASRPSGGSTRAARWPRACRELLAPLADRNVAGPGGARHVPAAEDPPAVVARLRRGAASSSANIPGRGSCARRAAGGRARRTSSGSSAAL